MIARLKHIAKRNNFFIYTKPYQLNIWGVRSKSIIPNQFDDEIHVFFTTDDGFLKSWKHYVFPCTTDPGTYWLKNPMSPKGTAMLAAGQYLDTYKMDLHRNKYKALCQRLEKVKVIRDYNRNAVLDFYNGTPDYGMFGINIHRANRSGTTYKVDNHSAGCQVFQKVEDFELFMKLCDMHRKLYGNRFSYTLIDKRMESRKTIKKVVLGIVGLSAISLGTIWIMNQQQELIKT